MRNSPPPLSRVMWSGVVAGVVFAGFVCYGVATSTWIVGSIEGGWIYPYVGRPTLRPLLVFAAILTGSALLLAIPATVRFTRALLLAWILFATAAHALLRTTAPHDLEALFVSPGANAFLTMAQEHSPGEVLGTFNRVRRHAPLHGQSNMPGKTILVHTLQLVSTRTDVLPWLLVILSNVGAVLMFGLARDLFRDDRIALYAAVLYLFTPARVLFVPLMNTVTPVFALAFGWLVMRWLVTGRSFYAGIAGVALYVLVFFEPLPLVIGLLFATLVVAAMARNEVDFRRFLGQTAVMILVFVAVAITVYAATGFHIGRAFGQIREHAVEFNRSAGRPYRVWALANPVEFVFAAGPAQFVLAAVAGPSAWRSNGRFRQRLTVPIVATSVGLFAVLIATDLIGINRGEVARLWIFLACFFQLPAAYICGVLGSRAVAAVLAITLLQVCLATALIGFVVP